MDRAAEKQQWLDQVVEDIVDPDIPIIDSHHHLWKDMHGVDYALEEWRADAQTGHQVVKSVFVECGTSYRTQGPEQERSLGETEFVAKQCRLSELDQSGVIVTGIVGSIDLTIGEGLFDLIQQHQDMAEGRFRGVRVSGARRVRPDALTIPYDAPEGLYLQSDFQQGVKLLGQLSLSCDVWHYHHQNREFYELARACPDTQLVLDHFGTPLGVGSYAEQRDEIFESWKEDIRLLSQCDNVVAKLGGLAMPDNGFGWHEQARPPTSDEFAEAQSKYYLHVVDCFGPDRCMVESNFPIDRFSISYHVLLNGIKKILGRYSSSERRAMFYDTAERIYC